MSVRSEVSLDLKKPATPSFPHGNPDKPFVHISSSIKMNLKILTVCLLIESLHGNPDKTFICSYYINQARNILYPEIFQNVVNVFKLIYFIEFNAYYLILINIKYSLFFNVITFLILLILPYHTKSIKFSNYFPYYYIIISFVKS